MTAPQKHSSRGLPLPPHLPRGLTFLTLLTVLLAGRAASAASSDTLFEEAFGHREVARAQQVTIQFELDGQLAGWSTALVTQGASERELKVLAAPILEALAPRLHEELRARLTAAVEANGFVSLAAFEEVGLTASYDPSRLLLQLTVPAGSRRLVVRDVSGRSAQPEPTVTSSHFSGYINLRLAEDLAWVPGQPAAVRAPLRIGLESAINIRDWVLEARGELEERPTPRWALGDVRLVRDDLEHAVRYVAGNLTTPPSSFLLGLPLLGLGAARNFSLDPLRQVLPQESFEFLLDGPSKVELLVNGRLLRTLQLEAGAHDLRGLVLEGGANQLEVVITDDLGVARRLTRRVGLAAGQLGVGVFEGALAFGFPLQRLSLDRTYDWNTPTFEASYRRGLPAALTLGGALLADPTTQAVDLEVLWATWFGGVALRGALSHRDTLGGAIGLRYELQRTLVAKLPSRLALNAEYRGAVFALPGEPLGARRSSYRVDASLAQGLSHGFFSCLTAQVRAEQLTPAPRLELGLALSKGFANGLGLMFDLTGSRRTGQPDELRARLNVVWAWPDTRRSVQVLTELDGHRQARAQLTGNQDLSFGEHQLRASASVAQDPAARGVSETIGYRGPRAEASVSHRLSSPVSGAVGVSNALQLRLGTALVFADGVFAWSRPVTGSFAIVAPSTGLEGQRVVVNATSVGAGGAIDGLGPAVLPDLQPYALMNVRVQAPELKLGTSLGQENYSLRPTYRSGALIRVGAEGTVFLRGRLHAGGAPVALSAGTLRSVSRATAAPMPFFTNRTGRFVLIGLEPGTYALQLDQQSESLESGESLESVEIVIPQGSAGVIDLGQVDFHDFHGTAP